MRILHTSDWHLGLSLHHRSFIEEQRDCIRQMVQLVQEEKIDIVIVSGDIFDSRVASSEAIALYSGAVTQICQECGAEMVVIAGNHDGAARLSSCSALLARSGLYVTGKLPQKLLSCHKENVEIFAIPYFHIDEVRRRYPQQHIDSYEMAMACLCDEIRSNWSPKCRHILAAHAYVTGTQLSESDHAALLGGAQQVGAQVFEGFDYVALGHLHRAQQPREQVCYSGSPFPYSFGEAEQDKSVSVYDTDSGEIRRIVLHESKRLHVISGTLQKVLEQAVQEPLEDYIKVEITDQPAGVEVLEMLRRDYPNLLCVTGKSVIAEGEQITLTAEEMETLSPQHVLGKFCQETAGYEPSVQQTEWFCKALAEAENGGDLQ